MTIEKSFCKKFFGVTAMLVVTLLPVSACSSALNSNRASSSQISSGDKPYMTSTEKFKCRKKISHVARNYKDCTSNSKDEVSADKTSDSSDDIRTYQMTGIDVRKSFCNYKYTHITGYKKLGYSNSYYYQTMV